MLAYFVRRLLGGVVTWLLASFLFYSLLVSPSIPGPEAPRYVDRPFTSPEGIAEAQKFLRAYEARYGLDKPWPLNYLAWLFNPNGASGQTLIFPGGEVTSVHLSAETLGFVHSGILVGDFGDSLAVEPGTPVLTAYGINLPLFLSFISATLFSSMLVVALQRRGRPPLYDFTPPDNPARTIWRRAELWPLG